MQLIKTEFPGLIIFQPKIWEDSRGYFFESYSDQVLVQHQVDIKFVQDNQARSTYGVMRGLHFQQGDKAQTKLIRVLSGAILDVAVDIRSGSPTFGKVFTIELSAENKKQLLVPKGFAHGYSVLSETAEVFYKCDEFYDKEAEGGIFLNDPELEIDWKIPAEFQQISEKDTKYPGLSGAVHTFVFKG